MSFLDYLNETRMNCLKAGVESPVFGDIFSKYHERMKMDWELTLDYRTGGLHGIRVMDRNEMVIPIPCTLAKRGRKVVGSRPLCDTFEYVCRPLPPEGTDTHSAYLKAISGWAESPFGNHGILRTVYAYVRGGTLFEDLKAYDERHAGDEGYSPFLKFLSDEELDGLKSGHRALSEHYYGLGLDVIKKRICWKVVGMPESEGDGRCWENRGLKGSWIDYYSTVKDDDCGDDVMDMVTGNVGSSIPLMPKFMASGFAGCFLISSNVEENFIGRFQSARQALPLTEDTDSLLRSANEMIARYGRMIGNSCFLCWESNLNEVTHMNDCILDEGTEGEMSELSLRSFHDEIDGILAGKACGIPSGKESKVMISVLTQGIGKRISNTYYGMFGESEYLRSISEWDKSCSWIFDAKRKAASGDGKVRMVVSTPSLEDIVDFAFGRYASDKEGDSREGRFVIRDEGLKSSRMLAMVKTRIYNGEFENDVIQGLLDGISHCDRYSRTCRRRLLSTACAVFRKHYNDRMRSKNLSEEEIRRMSISDFRVNEENDDRSYLFGRVFTLIKNFELIGSIKRDRGAKIEKNVDEYMNSPMNVIADIYFQEDLAFSSNEQKQMGANLRRKIEEILSRIESLYNVGNDPSVNRPLDYQAVLGACSQAIDCRNRSSEFEKNEKNEKKEKKDLQSELQI